MSRTCKALVIGSGPIMIGQAAVVGLGRLEHLLQPTKEATMVLRVEEAMNIA